MSNTIPRKAIVIGAGFSGISAATELATRGFEVDVYEKNDHAGGRCSILRSNGFTFDMGPSWYWMPDVFEWYFSKYGSSVDAHYTLQRLNPGYRINFGNGDVTDIPAQLEALELLFEKMEPGASVHLRKFLKDAGRKYATGMQELVFKPCNSLLEFAEWKMLRALFTMQLFTSLRKEVYGKFNNDQIRKILEFPVYFLGALPSNTPALYSILNYADLVLGTWYPMGGMYKIVEGMVRVAEDHGVRFHYNAPVEQILTQKDRATGVLVNDNLHSADAIIAAADYHHIESALLPPHQKNYTEAYWDNKVFAPSAMIFFLGVKGRVQKLLHHNLFFDSSFDQFAADLYTRPAWSEKPLFYVCAPSKTDPSVAPVGDENLFILVPVASGMHKGEPPVEKYFDQVIGRLEQFCGEEIRSRVYLRHNFTPGDFVDRYHACKGNAYGLANTLRQTAIFKPRIRNKKIKNLVYAGQLTVPGPGVPPALISGVVAAGELEKRLRR